MLNIHFLGKARMTYKGKPIYEQLGAKSYALISLLVLNENPYMSRDKIIGYLWPDSNDDAARYNLRYNLWLIKKTIQPDEKGHAFLQVDKETCGINEAYIFKSDVCDVIEFTPSPQDSISGLLALKERFEGDFLEGCYFNKCDAFNDLIIFERINFEKRKVKILRRLAELYEQENHYDECIETIHEILEIEPYDESFVSKILDIYVLSGKRASAINYYNKFSNQLAGSLGIVPTKELRDKFNELRSKMGEVTDRTDTINKTEDDDLSKHPDKEHLDIRLCGCQTVEYTALSELVAYLVDTCISADLDQCLKVLNKLEYMALAKIYPQIISDMPIEYIDDNWSLISKDVAICSSLKHLIKELLPEMTITISMQEGCQIDSTSKEILTYYNNLNLEGLTIRF